MEWLVPVLFVLASLAQWWMQRNRHGQDDALPESPSVRDSRQQAAPARREPQPQEEFDELGDLLEALGRRRHESPPPPVEHTEPPVLPSPAPQKLSPKKPELARVPEPEPAMVLEPSKPVSVPVFTEFPKAKLAPVAEPTVVFPEEKTPHVSLRPFPVAKRAESSPTHRWAGKLRSPDSIRDAIVLSEILAPPVSLR